MGVVQAGREHARGLSDRLGARVAGHRFERRVRVLDNAVAVGDEHAVRGFFDRARQLLEPLARVEELGCACLDAQLDERREPVELGGETGHLARHRGGVRARRRAAVSERGGRRGECVEALAQATCRHPGDSGRQRGDCEDEGR